MSKNNDPSQLLFELARTEGSDVVHLAYSPEFEALCRRINPSATTHEKHDLWERLLELGTTPGGRESDRAKDRPSAAPSATAPSPWITPVQADQGRPLRMATPPSESGMLFHVDPPAPEVQPWTTPAEPELNQELAEQRLALLASLAQSQLATYEQRVARILHRYPETRDSDIALCLRYWRTFQADVIERWKPLELEILFELDRIVLCLLHRMSDSH